MTTITVYADTNVIIETFRLGIWQQICQKYCVRTVPACVKEALAGDSLSHGYVKVDRSTLERGLNEIVSVSDQCRIDLAIREPSCSLLDEGERDLLAMMSTRGFLSASGLIATADRAAVRAVHRLGWLDATASLERIAKDAGVASSKILELADHQRESWLSQVRTSLLLGL